MSIIQVIKSAQLQARKDRNTGVVATLTTLIGEIEYASKAKGLAEATDADAVKIIRKFADNIGVVRDGYAKQVDIQSVNKALTLKIEKELVESFLPPPVAQLTEDELRGTVKEYVEHHICNLTMKDVMMYLKENFPGQYDGKTAQQVVKETLT